MKCELCNKTIKGYCGSGYDCYNCNFHVYKNYPISLEDTLDIINIGSIGQRINFYTYKGKVFSEKHFHRILNMKGFF